MAYIPADPMMLLSYINTQLRDNFSSLSSLCEDLDISEEDIVSKLSAIDYHYDPEQNKFR